MLLASDIIVLGVIYGNIYIRAHRYRQDNCRAQICQCDRLRVYALQILGNNFSEQSKATEDRIPDPEWPDNYFRALAEVKDKYDYILISDDICNSWLWENNIKYWQICPDLSLRDEYCARFVARGNNPTFVSQQMQVWDEWIQTCSHDLRAEKIFILKSNEYVEDVINNKVKPTYIHK